MAGSAAAILQQLDADVAAGWAAVGFVSYEVGLALEGLAPAGGSNWPDAAWWLCDAAAIAGVDLPAQLAKHIDLPGDLLDQERQFCRGVADILARIAAGEVYQVNLTTQGTVPMTGVPDPLAIQAAMQAAQPVPLGLAMRLPRIDAALGCGSMERFLHCEDGTVRTRPIKGTARRDADPRIDAANGRSLQRRAKERAENTMIVDMARNDLQRACQTGSVQVEALLQLVPYATLWHLESEVRGQLRAPELAPLLRATMPPASVTGCPKVQAMKVIGQLEQRRRGPYCGTVFCAVPGQPAEFAVAIRTLQCEPTRARIDVGAGIVADSRPQAEWQETLQKAQSAVRALAMLGAQ